MHITLIDESTAFDGYTPAAQPLGGAEKAFASLPAALARRGHKVAVFNRCRFRMTIDGAEWEPWERPRPARTDVLVAFRKPALLNEVADAGRRLLWLTGGAKPLSPPSARKLLEHLRPGLVLISRLQAALLTDLPGLARAVIPPGLRWDYLGEETGAPTAPPKAVVTTHPAHGLTRLLKVWCDGVHPACPEAQLHVFSAALDKGQSGGEVPEELRPVLVRALAGRDRGVVIRAPLGDQGMAAEYRSARVHLYPGHADDMGCFTLMESQACGLPAVARPQGAVAERLIDGVTGHLVPDDGALTNCAIRLLTDDQAFWSMNRDARLRQRERSWDVVAAAFEEAWA